MSPWCNTDKTWLFILGFSTFNLHVFIGVTGGFSCLSNPCVHGVCLDDLNTSYSCYCIDGYTGIQCQTNWDECWSSPCLNGATCIDGIAAFNCSCPPGFVGELCEENFNECDSNPCLNNGTCLDITNGYTCGCPTGYSGAHCEIDVAVCNSTNEPKCENGGVCIEGPGVTFTCRCQPGWEGVYCRSEIDECRSSPCLNGAVCIDLQADYACACLFGFTGHNCNEVVHICEDNPCKNSALCLTEEGHAECYCVPDYHGELCQFQYDECQLGQRCFNGGTCIDGVDDFSCSCPPKLTGVFCECLIIGSDEMDCTYVSPKPTTAISYSSSEVGTTKFSTTESISATTATTTVPNFTVTFTSTVTTPEFEGTDSNDTLTTTTDLNYVTSQHSSTSTHSEHTTEISEETTTEVTTTTAQSVQAEPSTEQPSTTTPEYETKVTLPPSTEIQSTSYDYSTKFETETSTTSIKQTLAPNVTFSTIPYGGSTETSSTEIITTTKTHFSTEPNILTEEPDATSSTMVDGGPVHNLTTPYALEDCSVLDGGCQNGGTCVRTSHGYQCTCPFDAEGPFCEIHLGIKTAAFSGDSYLSHNLNNFSIIALEFKARTLSPNGLLFYVNLERTYMALYLERGFLKFQFSCGFQTMLLSELEVPVNNGYDMNIKAILEFRKDLKHCDAAINVNDSSSMTGDQIAMLDHLVKPSAWIYFGRVPSEQSISDLKVHGFVGCMSNLKISNQKVDIFKDAEDGFAISECSSLVCLSSPCANGGTCDANGKLWRCNCKNGFLGKTCGISACDNNPCLFGGTCIPFTGSGYICLCPFGKHGHFCEHDLEITEPNFSSSVHGLSSFAAYFIPSGISVNMELKFRFIPSTMDQISILMFIGQKGHHDAFSDHMAVSFVKGYIMLTWNLGSGPRRIFTTRPIKRQSGSYLVRLGHLGRRAWLFVENVGNVTGRSPGNLVQLDVFPLLYLGGHDSSNFSTLPHDLPLHVGFSGCIFDVELKSGSVVMPLQVSKQVVGRSVGQCDTTECYEGICHNGGACIHHGSTFMCLCQDGWFGPLCADKSNPCDASVNLCEDGSTCFPLLSGYECDCPLGKTGRYCEIEENITDVSFSGRRSYASLGPIEIQPTNFNFIFDLRPLNTKGLVLFVGKESSFISLTIHNGLLELCVLTAKRKSSVPDVLTVRSNKLLAVGVWYKIQFGIYGRKVYISIDNILNTGIINPGETISITSQTLYLGGVADLSTLPENALSSLPTPFIGCIRIMYVDSRRIPLTAEGIKKARNVGDCDGTPCGGDYCANNGTCWLDSDVRPRCACPEPYTGEKCEILPNCTERLCKNRGRCQDSRCVCKNGWSGAFCESAMDVSVPQFENDGYLIIKAGKKNRRNVQDFGGKMWNLDFITAEKDGLLLWSSKDNNFIAIGFTNDRLKTVYSLKKINITATELSDVGEIADGIAHSLTINFKPLRIFFDNKLAWMQKLPEFEETELFSTDKFYLGGVKENMGGLIRKHFPINFQGCVVSVSFGNETTIQDFSIYEGENLGICKRHRL